MSSVHYRTQSPYRQTRPMSPCSDAGSRSGTPRRGRDEKSSRSSSPADHRTLPRIVGAHYADNNSVTAAFKNAGRDRALYDDGSVVCDRPELTKSHLGPGAYDIKGQFDGYDILKYQNRPRSRSNSPSCNRTNSPAGRKVKMADTTGFVSPKADDRDAFPRNRMQTRTSINVDIELDIDLVRGLR